jgi:hypothetical protein
VSREEVVANYERYLLANQTLMGSLGELRGKSLACWCAPLACHGDVLLRLANAPAKGGNDGTHGKHDNEGSPNSGASGS